MSKNSDEAKESMKYDYRFCPDILKLIDRAYDLREKYVAKPSPYGAEFDLSFKDAYFKAWDELQEAICLTSSRSIS